MKTLMYIILSIYSLLVIAKSIDLINIIIKSKKNYFNNIDTFITFFISRFVIIDVVFWVTYHYL